MYRLDKNDFLKHVNFVFSDLFCLQLVFLLPYLSERVSQEQQVFYASLQLIMSLVDLCLLFFRDAFTEVYRRGHLVEAKEVFIHQTQLFLIALVILFFQKGSEAYSRLLFFAMWAASLLLVYGGRILMKKLSVNYFRKKRLVRSVLLVTSRERVDQVIRMISMNKYSDYCVTGIGLIDGEEEGSQSIRGVPIVAYRDKIPEYIRDNVIDEVFLNLPPEHGLSSPLMDLCLEMGAAVHCSLEKLSGSQCRDTVEEFGGYTVLTRGVNFVTSKQILLKRAMDLAGSLVGLAVTGICFLFVAPLIYSKSPGPIFFTQTRVGLNGRKFKIYKFRSMYMDAEERKAALLEQNKMDGFMFKMDEDPRIIPGIGRFIRRTSIDELPQMWNVLKGDMSLVGTRPPTVDEYERYEYRHKSRLATKPGITGMWQVSGRSDITDFEKIVELDNQYIYNWSLDLDIKILCRTVLVVFQRHGSA